MLKIPDKVLMAENGIMAVFNKNNRKKTLAGSNSFISQGKS